MRRGEAIGGASALEFPGQHDLPHLLHICEGQHRRMHRYRQLHPLDSCLHPNQLRRRSFPRKEGHREGAGRAR